jgi:hypothetical protein
VIELVEGKTGSRWNQIESPRTAVAVVAVAVVVGTGMDWRVE